MNTTRAGYRNNVASFIPEGILKQESSDVIDDIRHQISCFVVITLITLLFVAITTNLVVFLSLLW